MKIQAKYPRNELLNILWSVQCEKRYIDDDDIAKIADVFEISNVEVEGVLTFYHFFHRKHSGLYTIYVDNSIISQHSGYKELIHTFENTLGIKMGSVTKDRVFGLFETSCIGLSDQEPACLINFYPFTNLTPDKIVWIINRLRNGDKLSEISDFPKSNIQYTPKHSIFFNGYQRYSALQKLKKMSPRDVISTIKEANLLGMGGALFPTGIKWETASNQEAEKKYIFCNADEGEPGTFKDRVLIQENPYMLIEGMIIAAYAIGAQEGFIYLRAEYRYLREILNEALHTYRSAHLLGERINGLPGFSFDIKIVLGAGAYVCGEETALIHSAEGYRGEPGNKSILPVISGYKGMPTVVNNVETLCAVPAIIQMGPKSWKKLGTQLSSGTKLLSVSGDCVRPGIYEIEWGMRIKELLNLCGAEDVQMIQFSGPSGRSLSIADFNSRICLEEIPCGGSVMIFNHQRDILQILKNFSDFFIAESCGICVPCRTGNFLFNKKIAKFIQGQSDFKDFEDIKSWSKIIQTTSRCGLGQMSSHALNECIQKFPEIFYRQISYEKPYSRTFSIEDATRNYDHIIQELNVDYEK